MGRLSSKSGFCFAISFLVEIFEDLARFISSSLHTADGYGAAGSKGGEKGKANSRDPASPKSLNPTTQEK